MGYRFAIVDLETTGANPNQDKILEVAIIVLQDGKVVDKFESLVDPEVTIPTWISRITGITPSMIEGAPKFYQIAKQLVLILKDCIFVAHNANFDFGFLRSEFSSLGYTYSAKRLCTVKLARRHLPGHKSYSLGNLCNDLGITIGSRHRAMGDSEGCATLFLKICQEIGEEALFDPSLGAAALPPALSNDDISALPEACGIYYFKDKDDNILYVGKSRNIQKRVLQHFREKNNSKKFIALQMSLAKVEAIVLGDALMSSIMELNEIKRHSPFLNRTHKSHKYPYGISLLADESGYLNFDVILLQDEEVITVASHLRFRKESSAWAEIHALYSAAFGTPSAGKDLDTFIQQMKTALGTNFYNERIKAIYHKELLPSASFDVITSGRSQREEGVLQIREGKLKKISFYESGELTDDFELQHDIASLRLLAKALPRYSCRNLK